MGSVPEKTMEQIAETPVPPVETPVETEKPEEKAPETPVEAPTEPTPPVEEKKAQSEIQKRIGLAFARTDDMYPSHIAETLKGHNPGPDASGSVFDEVQTVASLIEADWEPYEHPAILEGCTAFKAPIKGMKGIVDLASLHSFTKVKLVDPKNTSGTYGGGLMAEVQLKVVDQPLADFSVIILGIEQGREMVFTFHPGEPLKPTEIDKAKWKDQVVTVHQALERGFRYGKVRVVEHYEPSIPVEVAPPVKKEKPKLSKADRLRELVRKGKELARAKKRKDGMRASR